MRRAGKVVKDTLCMLEAYIKPGIETIELDGLAEEFIRSQGAIPGFKGLYGFPATLCISVEDEVVHGKPGKRILEEGEIVGIDAIENIENHFKNRLLISIKNHKEKVMTSSSTTSDFRKWLEN